MNIKKILLGIYYKNRIVKKAADYFINKYRFSNIIKRIKSVSNDTWFLVLTPYHGNLGDHAIAIAEKELLEDINQKNIEITGAELEVLQRFNKLSIFNHRRIMINGGGNLGVLWPSVDQLIRDIVRNNPDSPIIVMPSTAYYDESEMGMQFLNYAIDTYNSHKHIKICARENITYEFLRNKVKNVFLMPDMVLSLKYQNESIESRRNGCLLCLRNDAEKTMQDSDIMIVETVTKSIFDKVAYTDTVLNSSIKSCNRKKELYNKLSEINGSQLFITDRLHGMLFAAITETPCIVLNSKSPKVKGCYSWIENLSYIICIDNIYELQSAIDRVMSVEQCEFDNYYLKTYYNELKKMIMDEGWQNEK